MKRMWLWCLLVAVLITDQLTKWFALQTMVEGKPIPIIPGFFNLTLVFNPGAAFGMFSGLPDTQRRIALGVVSFLAIIVVFRFMLKEAKDDIWSQCALFGILAGAIGNIADRFRFDSVVDFLDFYVKTHHWPAFNVADSAICIGVTILIVRALFGRKKAKKSVENAPVESVG